MDLDLNEIDQNLSALKKSNNAPSQDNRTAEDDSAIAEAIAQVENELNSEQNSGATSFLILGAIFVGGIVASRVASYFMK